MSTPAGWYPQDDGRQRYWDGTQWTEHFAPADAGAAAPAVGQPTTGVGVAPVASPGKAARPWFKKKRFIIPGAVAVFFLAIGMADAASGGGTPEPTQAVGLLSASSAPTPTTGALKATATPTPSPKVTPTKAAVKVTPKPAAPTLTVAQANALGAAEDYLDYAGFSKKGLIKQLAFEGYETKDIDAALATMKVDWNAEAAESAKAYVDMTHFSRSGLIKQLRFEGYTSKQAAHGADAAGL